MRIIARICTIIGLSVLSLSALANLPSVAVLDFQKTNTVDNIKIRAKETAHTALLSIKNDKTPDTDHSLSLHITQYLAQSHKFDVLDRMHIAAVLEEQKFANTDYASKDTLEKTGQLLGADYLIMGLIENLHIETKDKPLPYTDTVETHRIGDMQISVTVVDAHSGQVVAAMPVIVHEEIVFNNEKPLTEKAFQLALKDAAAKKITAHIIDSVFPPRVMQVEDGRVYINRGDASNFALNDTLTLYKKTTTLTDPDTGNTVGYTKNAVGTVEVTDINKQYTIAKIVSGDTRNFTDAFAVKETQPAIEAKNTKPLTPGSSDKPFQW